MGNLFDTEVKSLKINDFLPINRTHTMSFVKEFNRNPQAIFLL